MTKTIPPTAEELADIRDNHLPVYAGDGYQCRVDYELWPCATIRLVSTYEQDPIRADGIEPEGQWLGGLLMESPHHDLYAERLTSAIAIKNAAKELAKNAANHPSSYVASLAGLRDLVRSAMNLETAGTFI